MMTMVYLIPSDHNILLSFACITMHLGRSKRFSITRSATPSDYGEYRVERSCLIPRTFKKVVKIDLRNSRPRSLRITQISIRIVPQQQLCTTHFIQLLQTCFKAFLRILYLNYRPEELKNNCTLLLTVVKWDRIRQCVSSHQACSLVVHCLHLIESLLAFLVELFRKHCKLVRIRIPCGTSRICLDEQVFDTRNREHLTTISSKVLLMLVWLSSYQLEQFTSLLM